MNHFCHVSCDNPSEHMQEDGLQENGTDYEVGAQGKSMKWMERMDAPRARGESSKFDQVMDALLRVHAPAEAPAHRRR